MQRTWLSLVGLTIAAGAQAENGIRPEATMLQYPDVSATHIVFAYANDIWLVPHEGGTAVRLASPPGAESFPRFSPDGESIAFVGNYEGNQDLYVLPATGSGLAHRVTHHPSGETLCDWTPDGRLLFWCHGLKGMPRSYQLHTVSADGGLPEKLPVPYGAAGAISPDGQWLAYTPHTRDTRTWKRYRGGMATDIWLFNLNDHSSKRMTDWEGTDTQPMWHGETVYYASDAGSEHRLNIWAYDTRSGETRQITGFAEYDIKWPSIGPGSRGQGEIIFQNGPRIYLLDLENNSTSPVDIVIPGDRPTLRPRQVDFSKYLTSGDISSTGKRVAVEARGEIWSLPAEEGISRNLTRTSGAAERDPIWSPDGRWIAYLSDATGEYEVYLTQSDGRGEARQLTSNGTRYRYLHSFSPDSKSICFQEKDGTVYLLDVESSDLVKVATDPGAGTTPVSWSHDSAWLAFSMMDEDNTQQAVHLYNIADAELTRVTDPMFTSTWPTFDRKGEYLFFASNRSFKPTYSDVDTTWVYRNTDVLLAVPLNSEVENPWLPENEEEEWDEDSEEDAEGDSNDDTDVADDDEDSAEDEAQESSSPLHGVWEGSATGFKTLGMDTDEVAITLTLVVREDGSIYGTSESMGESHEFDEVTFDEASGAFTGKRSADGFTIVLTGSLQDGALEGTWTIAEHGAAGTFSVNRTDKDVDEDAAERDTDEPVVIELEGFEARAMQLPVDAGAFMQLAVNDKNQLLYLRRSDDVAAIKLFDMEDRDEGERNVLGGVARFQISADGKKLAAMAQAGQGISVVSAAPGQTFAKKVPTDSMKATIEPREEWRQIFHDAWRIQRDFFYDQGMHGVDWPAMRDRYAAMLDDCITREDLSFVIREMISELNVGHAYYGGGDVESAPSENVGMLGCDYELVDGEDGPAYRIARIHQGAPWDTDARGPLSQPGVDVKEGDYLLAVNGIPLDTDRDPFAAFIGKVDKVTEITVSEQPVIDDTARQVLIKPIDLSSGEMNLRHRAWVEANRAYVEQQTEGRVGYIYVPNTGVLGQNELVRQFYGQRGKEALIIDERWNGGGQIPTRFIELLNRPRTNYWAVRDGRDWAWPPDSHQGPKVMLINGLAGSGGDMFPALFRQAGLGKLIGTRTWGGLVGISGNPPLIDGGYTAVPTFGFYETDGTWGIEGHGVDPDIVVLDDPALMVNGGDPQLDAAIEHILGELEQQPYIRAPRPASPDRSGMGIDEADK